MVSNPEESPDSLNPPPRAPNTSQILCEVIRDTILLRHPMVPHGVHFPSLQQVINPNFQVQVWFDNLWLESTGNLSLFLSLFPPCF